jgi:hypothetical protein
MKIKTDYGIDGFKVWFDDTNFCIIIAFKF